MSILDLHPRIRWFTDESEIVHKSHFFYNHEVYGGEELDVTENAYQMLCHWAAIEVPKDVWYWLNVICINQEDVREISV